MTRKRIIHAVSCTVLFVIGFCPVLGQKSHVDLVNQRIDIQMENQALGVVLGYLMKNYDIPIGFEQSTLDRDHSDYTFQTNLPAIGRRTLESIDGNIKLDIEVKPDFAAKKHPITVNIKNGMLKEALDLIVGQMENYKWEINDGVVNIFPVRGRDERFRELMETKIENFSVADGKTVNDITRSIVKLREFNGWLRKNTLYFNPARTGSSILLDAQYGRGLSNGMNFSNLSFRQLLNEIAKNKKGAWILKWKGRSALGEEHIDLDI